MTLEQAQLVLDIVSQLDSGAITGKWPHEECRHCAGENTGYDDSRSFTHRSDCVVLKIEALQETMRGE